MIKPLGLAHVNINVTDLERSEKFYRDILGLKPAGRVPGRVVWMNWGQHGKAELFFHNIALYQVPGEKADNHRQRPGLNHVAFELESAEAVEKATEWLREKGVKVLKGPHLHIEDLTTITYFEDPDGNVLEISSPKEVPDGWDAQAWRDEADKRGLHRHNIPEEFPD
ncbi:MAG: VOC family protein [Candidatus Tectomicrobia bacterium]|nr:VOC family protein [Candidatus Tectomicrobia bacterium]